MKLVALLKWPYYNFRHPFPDHVRQFDYLDWNTQRRLAYQQIDKGGFGYWTVFVAGIGFLTDAYDIFAVNTVLPMLSLVYFNGGIPKRDGVLIGLSLLVGTLFGQLLLGVLGDRYGRRRVYGVELAVLAIATILMAIASKGALSGTNKVAWIACWRFVMGIGIGGDYPLSSVILAEFAPRRHRGTMLSSLFYMQACGALIANIVTMITVYVSRSRLPSNSSICDAHCKEAVDIMWRWIVGIGAIPPTLAIFLRWWIPESPRYTMEVEKDPDRAMKDVQTYFRPQEGVVHSPSTMYERATESTIVATGSSPRSSNQPALTFGEDQDPVELKDLKLTESALPLPSLPQPVRINLTKETWKEWGVGLYGFLFVQGNWTDLAGTSLTWMALDFAFYCLSVNNPRILNKLWNTEAESIIYNTLMQNAYRAMIAVSIGSIIGGGLAIAFARYRWSLQIWGFWILSAVFIVVGVCFVTLLGTRYFAAVIVLYSVCSLFFNFGPNTTTYVIAAEVFPTKYRCTCHGISAAAGKLGSIIAQVFLAYAKFGHPAVGVSDVSSPWLGWVTLIFTGWMAFGAIVTRIWVPNPVDIWGRSRTLEELGQGKVERRRLEREERESWRALAPGSPNV